ncbi:curlin [Chelativorans salis]|uniref:Curlin n=1 Tax=Chelativorans salis TaxID=2978478 RepID=A0ABT2LJS8_9HYPH|nr:curlin [Chelativorans sp. EGI FJ00035]MCT7374855.1 curlin [Chelativorans sp. EGI FJ00035]
MFRTIRAIAAAATIAAGLATAPAFAGGSVSLSYIPSDPGQAQALQTGLGLYALAKGIKSGSIKQKGFGNAAGLLQNGQGNLGIIHQKGNGHTGTVQQNGNGNTYGLFQFGKNTQAHAVQNGHGQAGAIVQLGW